MKYRKSKSPDIHPTAVVHPQSRLDQDVSIGPYAVIGPEVEIGAGSEVMNHATIEGPTVIGRGNRIYPYASIGQDPQDKKFTPHETSRLEIGDGNVIREFVTLNRGTEAGGGVTRVGNENWIMAYCHVAHDCQVGNETIFANNATLGGHVTIEDQVYLGGFTAVHQFCTIGRYTMTGGHTMIAQDVPPFVIAVGNRAKLFGVNKIGLERAGFSAQDIREINEAYKLFFRGKGRAEENLRSVEDKLGQSPLVMQFVSFIRASTRGIVR